MFPSTNILYRVLKLQSPKGEGTCFTLDVSGRQYIVTARHIVEGIENLEELKLLDENNKILTPVSVVVHDDPEIDVAVMTFGCKITHEDFEVNPSSRGMKIGQNLLFLGFPYGLSTKFKGNLPLVKGCIFSGRDEIGHYYLDGHNNPGFSGGPVVLCGNPSKPAIVGIIEGFHIGDTNHDSYNSGIIIASRIEHALDLIEDNPAGFKFQTKKSP